MGSFLKRYWYIFLSIVAFIGLVYFQLWVLAYIVGVFLVLSFVYILFELLNDKLPIKFRSSSNIVSLLIILLGIFSQSRIVKQSTGLDYPADVADFGSACVAIAALFILVLRIKFGEYMDELTQNTIEPLKEVIREKAILDFKEKFDKYTDELTQNTIEPLKNKIHELEVVQKETIQDFKKDHIKIYNLSQLNAFTNEDPIFSHKIVKEEGYLHIASLMRDFDVVLRGKLIIRSYDQFLNILNILTNMLDTSYNITIVDHINVLSIPTTMSGGYSLIEEYSMVLSNLIAKVNSYKRIVIVDRDEDRKHERLLLLLFSQFNSIPATHLCTSDVKAENGTKIEVSKYFGNRTRILIIKNGCDCLSSKDCIYCYSIKFVSPYNGKSSDDLLKSEVSHMKTNPSYSEEFPNYIRLFHTQKNEYTDKFNHDKMLFSIDLNDTTRLTKETIFDGLPHDKNKYYTLYKEVNFEWDNNVKSESPNNIYGCDTTILENEIEDWLNRPFYQYVLKQNSIIAGILKNKGKTIKRFFIIDKVRESKIQALIEILKEHIKNGIDVSIVSTKNLRERNVPFIYDFNFVENNCIFEIAGLRRGFNIGKNKFGLIVSDKSPTYVFWEKYARESDMYKKIEEFKNVLNSIKVDITMDNIKDKLYDYVLTGPTMEKQKNQLSCQKEE